MSTKAERYAEKKERSRCDYFDRYCNNDESRFLLGSVQNELVSLTSRGQNL